MLAVAACKNAGYPRQRPWAFVSAWFDEAPTRKVFGVSSGCSWRTRRWRRSADVLRSCESLDDEHRCAAVPAHEGGPDAVSSAVVAGFSDRWLWPVMQKFTSGGDVSLAVGVGEQPVVTDAMETRWQHMQQESAHELVGRHGHGFVASTPMFAVVLPTERDAAIVTRNESRVRDRDPMRVARQVGEHRLGSCEWALRVDHPLALSQWHEPVGKGIGVGQI